MSANTVQLGMYVKWEGQPYVVIDKEFYSPAKGASFIKTKIKHLMTGKIMSIVYKGSEQPEEINVQNMTVQYLYEDGANANFMDPVTFEQVSYPLDQIQGRTDFLHTEGKYVATVYEEKVVSIQIPIKMTLTVTETTDAVKGNTATGASKEATVETGAKVQVPLFINVGDVIVINTDERTYVSKG